MEHLRSRSLSLLLVNDMVVSGSGWIPIILIRSFNKQELVHPEYVWQFSRPWEHRSEQNGQNTCYQEEFSTEVWADFHLSIIFMPNYIIFPSLRFLFWLLEFYFVAKGKEIVLGNRMIHVFYKMWLCGGLSLSVTVARIMSWDDGCKTSAANTVLT